MDEREATNPLPAKPAAPTSSLTPLDLEAVFGSAIELPEPGEYVERSDPLADPVVKARVQRQQRLFIIIGSSLIVSIILMAIIIFVLLAVVK